MQLGHMALCSMSHQYKHDLPLTLQLFKDSDFHLQHLFGLLSRLHLQGHSGLAQLIQDLIDLPKPTTSNLPGLWKRVHIDGNGRKSQRTSVVVVVILCLTTFHLSLTTSAPDRMSVCSPAPLILTALCWPQPGMSGGQPSLQTHRVETMRAGYLQYLLIMAY